MQSLLPDYLEQDTIGRMQEGDIGFTLFWAMYAERDRHLWINDQYPIFPSAARNGTTIFIRRTSRGVEVDTSTIGDRKYTADGAAFLGTFTALPVTLISRITDEKQSPFDSLD